MRILIYGLNFAPELTGIGKYTGELAAYLANHGQQVRVVTTPPYYPHWQIASGYSGWAYRKEQYQGAEVIRCPLWVPRKPNGIKRVLYLASFALSSLPVMIFQVWWKPDVVINIAPAIATTPFALLIARLSGGCAWLHIQDFELDAAIRMQILPGLSAVSRWLQASESWLLKKFDRVSTISQRMQEALIRKGVPEDKTVLLPNWVDDQAIYPLESASAYRLEWGIDPEEVIILYSGNMGEKQGLEVLIEAAVQLQAEKKIRFVLCGEGAARAGLESRVAGLSNVRFLPLQPVERLNQLLNAADIHVLTQRACSADLVMPSKLAGMLASGKPVIATARPETELGQVVQQVGFLVPPEDPAALVKAILHLRDCPEVRMELGERGRQYIENHWTKEKVLLQYIHDLQFIAGNNSAGQV